MRKYFVWDVESIGLHGEGFAVGWVVISENGAEHSSGLIHCPPHNARGDQDGRDWVLQNAPDLPYTNLLYPFEVRQAFWAAWVNANYVHGALTMVADCPWPVEARFLNQVIDDVPGREKNGPYPIFDVGTARLMAGLNPIGSAARLEGEFPAHNPLADARQSARLFVEALNITKAAWAKEAAGE